jgi:protein-S-isoprenylcysteine O-methyltransferase Ste14
LKRRAVAWSWGVLTHAAFAFAVGSMAWAFSRGMHVGLGRLEGMRRWIADGALLLQFPLVHSALLGRRGARILARMAPPGMGRTLSTTTFSAVAALQLAATFWLWSPGGGCVWRGTGALGIGLVAAHVLAWAFLVVALHHAGLGLQTGWIGWRALLQDRAPVYPPMPQRGLFAICRQPVYVGFFLVLWTGPKWSVDRLALAGVWGVYCLLAPRLKERRHARIHGERFEDYRRRVPYMIPRMFA